MKIKYNYKLVRAIGYAVLCLAIFNFALDYFNRDLHPFNPGVVLANEVAAIVGVITIVIARCFQNYETRLDEIKNVHKS